MSMCGVWLGVNKLKRLVIKLTWPVTARPVILKIVPKGRSGVFGGHRDWLFCFLGTVDSGPGARGAQV